MSLVHQAIPATNCVWEVVEDDEMDKTSTQEGHPIPFLWRERTLSSRQQQVKSVY